MTRNVVVFAAGTLLFFAIFGVALLFTSSLVAGTVMLVGAIPALVWLYFYDLRREERESAGDEVRFHELSALSRAPNFELAVSRPTSRRFAGISIATGLIFVLISLGVPASDSLASISTMLLGSTFVAGGLALLFTAKSKRVVKVSRAGIETPGFRSIPWDRIYGVYIQEITIRSTRIESLMFHVPDVGNLADQFSGLMRWVYRHRPRTWPDAVSVILSGTSERPRVVYQIARLLWTEMTGRNNDWNPNMSAEFNVAVSEMNKASAFLRGMPAPGTPYSPVHNPDKLKAALNTIADSGAVISNEVRRKSRIVNAMAWSAIVVFVIYVATMLWKYVA